MDHFQDIVLLPDLEFPAPHLMNALYSKLHRVLAEMQADDIGVSFPDLDEEAPSLGARLRLHGSRPALEALMGRPWLAGLRDHVQAGPISPVPQSVAGFRVVRRVQCKSSPDRERRRLMRRKGLDAQQARERIPNSTAQMLPLPFAHLTSSSTGQSFRLFVAQGPVQATAVTGRFNAYGLSAEATVPWF